MYQPIDSNCGSHWIFKNLLSFGKRQIAGNPQAATFVTIGQQGKTTPPSPGSCAGSI
jgi:hypothetical protein